MLQEIRGVRQDDAAPKRQWFQDEFFDLFVWTDRAANMRSFQLCYDRLGNERVLTRSKDGGFGHRRVDDGARLPIKNMTPIMVADARFVGFRIAGEFERRATELDPQLRQFIRLEIDEAVARLAPVRRHR